MHITDPFVFWPVRVFLPDEKIFCQLSQYTHDLSIFKVITPGQSDCSSLRRFKMVMVNIGNDITHSNSQEVARQIKFREGSAGNN